MTHILGRDIISRSELNEITQVLNIELIRQECLVSVGKPMIKARRFLVSGQVQGVGYRFFSRDAAYREDLSGFVRNLPDGRVEAQAEGEQEALDRFQRSLGQGPGAGRVDEIFVEECTPTGDLTTFQVISS